MKKLTFTDVVKMINGKRCLVKCDYPDMNEPITPVISEYHIGIGFVALESDDKFTLMDDGRIRFKSLDDGNGFIKIAP